MTPSIDNFAIDSFLHFVKTPENTQEIFKIQQALLGHPNRKEMAQWAYKAAMADESFMSLFESRYLPSFPLTKELEACEEGTLGNEVAKHLIRNGISLDFAGLDSSVFYQVEHHPLTYLATRAFRNHDVFHVVLGLGVAPVDEYNLLNFQLAQFSSAYHFVLMAAGYLHMAFYKPEQMRDMIESTHRHFQMGKNARFFPGYKFEENWKTPIAEVRRELRIEV
jgi:ubiquinone biosynthesis protein Coq4